MKTQIGLMITFIGLFSWQTARAQGITYLSNVGLASSGSKPVGSNSWLAAMFATGDNPDGYLVDSVQLAMANATGNASDFEAMIYGLSPNPGPAAAPGTSIGALDGSLNPSTAGVYTYTPASDITLSPDTDYFIVLTAGTGFPTETYEWSYAGTDSYNPTGGWIADPAMLSSSDGSTWIGSGENAQFAITATPIPEPSPSLLFLLGGGLFVYVRKQKQHWNLCENKHH